MSLLSIRWDVLENKNWSTTVFCAEWVLKKCLWCAWTNWNQDKPESKWSKKCIYSWNITGASGNYPKPTPSSKRSASWAATVQTWATKKTSEIIPLWGCEDVIWQQADTQPRQNTSRNSTHELLKIYFPGLTWKCSGHLAAPPSYNDNLIVVWSTKFTHSANSDVWRKKIMFLILSTSKTDFLLSLCLWSGEVFNPMG